MEIRLSILWILTIAILLTSRCLGFKFTIVHNNDMQARFDPVKSTSEKCLKEEDEIGLCFGGFARVASAVAKARAEGPTLYLNAGNTFQGSSWFTVFKGDLTADLMNMLNPDAMSLGNHEFDDNVDGLLPFLEKVKFPVVCCNLNLSVVPKLKSTKSLVRSVIIEKFEMKIGIIGYLTPQTKNLVQVIDVGILDEIPCINAEAAKLTEQGVKIIIALGHSGYEMDQDIATNCKDIDVVVGGHSHSFLFTGVPPEKDIPEGNYPTVVTRPNGQQVPVVQAYAYTKYMGRLEVEFDTGGHLITYRGSPILLDNSVELDKNVSSYLDTKREKLSELDSQVIGNTKVVLNGDRLCRQSECNLGNFIADAMVYGRVSEDAGGLYWTDAGIAVINAGGIRASVDPGPDGVITILDLATILPFGNNVSITRIKGRELLTTLEHSASVRRTSTDGGFLQVSGIRMVINYNRPKGKRVTSIDVLCADCRIPQYESLERDKYYSIVVPNFLMNGGDGYHHLKNQAAMEPTQLKLIDREILSKYYQEHKVIYPGVEGRITIVEKILKDCASLRSQAVLGPIVLVTLYIFL